MICGAQNLCRRRKHTNASALKGQAALKEGGIGRLQRSVGGKLNRSTLHKCACRHNNLILVAGHCPGLWRDIGIHRRACLNAAAEGAKALGRAGDHALDNIRALFLGLRLDGIAERAEDVCRKMRGFDAPDTVFTGVETRTSSPVRITRGDDLYSLTVQGLIPCGEGAGYAGGIMSAAVDGIRVAEAIMARYAPLD